MKSYLLAGLAGSGKTAVAVGLASLLRRRGEVVGYRKVYGETFPADRPDPDAVLMKEWLGLPEPVEDLRLFRETPCYLDGHPDQQKVDLPDAPYTCLVLEGGSALERLRAAHLDLTRLARRWDAGVILVGRARDDLEVDRLLLWSDHLVLAGCRVLGTILTQVHPTNVDSLEARYRAVLAEAGSPLLGVIPQQAALALPTVREYLEVSGATVLSGAESLDRPVEDVMIGAMSPHGALPYLRRMARKLVVTGGDRADLALLALETNTSGLLLTGGFQPALSVLTLAADKGTPVLLTGLDTMTTVERLHQVTPKLRAENREGIQRAGETLEKYCRIPL